MSAERHWSMMLPAWSLRRPGEIFHLCLDLCNRLSARGCGLCPQRVRGSPHGWGRGIPHFPALGLSVENPCPAARCLARCPARTRGPQCSDTVVGDVKLEHIGYIISRGAQRLHGEGSCQFACRLPRHEKWNPISCHLKFKP